MKDAWLCLASACLAVLAAARAADDCAALRADLEGARARIQELEAQVTRLKGELATQQEARIEREREFLRYTQGIAQLQSLATLPTFTPRVEDESRPRILDVPAETPAAPAVAPAPRNPAVETPADVRDREIFFALRALLAADEVTSLDLLESGRLAAGAVGPVVLRVQDERGRPLGAIAADRLRLEGSRAARTITLVLENGYERRGGERLAFEGGTADGSGRAGVRRIALEDCDPIPWIERVPELFGELERAREIDDGRHDLARLRAALNDLLRREAASGWYRVQGLGGVQGRALRDVAIERLDRDGRVERRYFADRLWILREAAGLQLVLEGGSHERAGVKTPFLDGRCRLFLPRADVASWERALIPGLERVEPAPGGDAK